jgi:hypothetical protein
MKNVLIAGVLATAFAAAFVAASPAAEARGIPAPHQVAIGIHNHAVAHVRHVVPYVHPPFVPYVGYHPVYYPPYPRVVYGPAYYRPYYPPYYPPYYGSPVVVGGYGYPYPAPCNGGGYVSAYVGGPAFGFSVHVGH